MLVWSMPDIGTAHAFCGSVLASTTMLRLAAASRMARKPSFTAGQYNAASSGWPLVHQAEKPEVGDCKAHLLRQRLGQHDHAAAGGCQQDGLKAQVDCSTAQPCRRYLASFATSCKA